MLHTTDGIVLRSVKYGDTSAVVTIYTRLFGMQAYLINGVRTGGKNSKAHLYQSGSILDMQVYHNSLKKLQRVREARWKVVYKTIFTHVIKNSIVLFMAELLQKSTPEEEQNEALFRLIEDKLLFLDDASSTDTANLPVHFMLQLSSFLGFGIENNFSEELGVFSLAEGKFTSIHAGSATPSDIMLNQWLSAALSSLKTNAPLLLNGTARRELLRLLEKYYQYHVAGFSELKSLKILQMVMQ